MLTNYGLIGCGMMGQEHIRNIALLPDTRIAAIFEPDRHMADQAKAMEPNAKLCASIDELLEMHALDCLVIASPNHLHMGQLEQILAIRPLPLLVEKPLYTRADDIDRIVALDQTYGAPIWVGMEYRYMPPMQTFIDQVPSATGGPTMLTIREHRFPFLEKVGDWNRFNRNTGGTLVEKCCHFFDLMRHILQSDPVRIMASAGQDVNHLDETYAGETPDIWDAGYVIVDFASGQRAMLELCMYAEGSEFQEEISAVGPSGKIEVKVPGPSRFWPTHLGQPPVSQVIVSPRNPKAPQLVEVPVDPTLQTAGDHNGSTFYQHSRFLSVVREKHEVEVSLIDGAWAVEMGLAAQASATTGRAVDMPSMPFKERSVSRSGAIG